MFQRAPRGWAYTEASPKNRPRGASVLKVSRKELVIFAVPEGEHCPVFILDTYMERVPPSANSRDNCLYLRPMPSSSELLKPSFTNQPVGKHTLATMVKEACMEAGILGGTNDSLQATRVTTMFTVGLPEKVIQGQATFLLTA